MSAKILLLQDAVHLPSFGGGNKANRLLLRELAALGFECTVLARLPSAERLRAGPFSLAALAARGFAVRKDGDGGLSYRHEGVEVTALDLASPDALAHVGNIVERAQPDWILVSDDHQAAFLEAALRCKPDRVVVLVHTHFHLPFGPEAGKVDVDQHHRMRRARSVVVVSDYSRRYVREHGGMDATIIRFPVFGRGPFECVGRPDAGFVTMINPCLFKGLPIFLDLADHFPDVAFAAVPTWGADDPVIDALSLRHNIALLAPDDDIGAVLRDARVLVAPSLVPETFGYVAIDAMLRGVPVMASGLGGQREAMLGAGQIIPVGPLVASGAGLAAPPQDLSTWRTALRTLLTDAASYRQKAEAGREAAHRFLRETDVRHFVGYLAALKD
jgi:glycosyltransferase involved in cell wall biosynthesis